MRSGLALGAGLALGLVAARRLVLLGAALVPPRPVPDADVLPTVTLVVSACNEAPTIDRLLSSLDTLDYPGDRLEIVLVDDASDDLTAPRLRRFAAGKPRTRVIELSRREGKAGALTAAIHAAEPADVLVAVDADLRLHPQFVRRLAGAFDDPGVGAAGGFAAPANADASIVARYASVEVFVHQLVTSAGKDRLDLNPPTLSAAAYRRSALEGVGGFRAGRTGEDIAASVALTQAGWRTRFVRDATAETLVAERLSDYVRQHLRWAWDVVETAPRVRDRSEATASRRAELALAGLGYADRLLVLALFFLGPGPRRLAAAYLGLRAVEVAAALERAGRLRRLPAHLAALALLFPLDVAASLAATVARRSRESGTWVSPRRSDFQEWGTGEPGAVSA